MKRNSGFLLIELIFAISLIIIILNIVFLDLDIIYRIKLNHEVSNLVRDLNNIRLDALNSNWKNSIQVYKNNKFQIIKNSTSKENIIVKTVEVETFEIYPSKIRYIFNENGTPDRGGSFYIEHKYGLWEITIQPVTGKITLKK